MAERGILMRTGRPIKMASPTSKVAQYLVLPLVEYVAYQGWRRFRSGKA